MNMNNRHFSNNLLNYMSMNVAKIKKARLIKTARNSFSEEEISDAYNVLLNLLFDKNKTKRGRPAKNPDILALIYRYIKQISDRVLTLDADEGNASEEMFYIKEEVFDYIEVDNEISELDSASKLRKEQREMKSQMSRISSVIKQMKSSFEQRKIEKNNCSLARTIGIKRKFYSNEGLRNKRNECENMEALSKKGDLEQCHSHVMDESLMSSGLLAEKIPSDDKVVFIKTEDGEVEMDMSNSKTKSEAKLIYISSNESSENSPIKTIKQEISSELDEFESLEGKPIEVVGRGSSFEISTNEDRVVFIKNEDGETQMDTSHINFNNRKEQIPISIYSSEEDNFECPDKADEGKISSGSKSRSTSCVSGNRSGSFTILPASTSLINVPIYMEVFQDGSIKMRRNKNIVRNTEFTCPLCGDDFNRELELIEHISYHENGSMLQCSKCDFCCIRQSAMRQHLEIIHLYSFNHNKMHIDKNSFFVCMECKFESKSRVQMLLHLTSNH